MKTILHGEVRLTKVNAVQGNKINTKGEYHIIAPSETSGNHHVIDLKKGVEIYEKDGTLYMKNEVETDVRCVVKDRHDNITLEPGIWEIGSQQEYDYLTMEKRNVAD